jgi:hypothetical protein
MRQGAKNRAEHYAERRTVGNGETEGSEEYLNKRVTKKTKVRNLRGVFGLNADAPIRFAVAERCVREPSRFPGALPVTKTAKRGRFAYNAERRTLLVRGCGPCPGHRRWKGGGIAGRGWLGQGA